MKFFPKREVVSSLQMAMAGDAVLGLETFAKRVHGANYSEALDRATDYLMKGYDPNLGSRKSYARKICSMVKPQAKVEDYISEEEFGLPRSLVQEDVYSLSGAGDLRSCGEAVLRELLADRKFIESGVLSSGVAGFREKFDGIYDLGMVVTALESLMEEEIPAARALLLSAAGKKLKFGDVDRIQKSQSTQHSLLKAGEALKVVSKRRLGVKEVYRVDRESLEQGIRACSGGFSHRGDYGVLSVTAMGDVVLGQEESLELSTRGVMSAFLSRSSLKLIGEVEGDSWYLVSKSGIPELQIQIPGGSVTVKGNKVNLEEILCS